MRRPGETREEGAAVVLRGPRVRAGHVRLRLHEEHAVPRAPVAVHALVRTVGAEFDVRAQRRPCGRRPRPAFVITYNSVLARL